MVVRFSPDTKQYDGTSYKYRKLEKALGAYLQLNGRVNWAELTKDEAEIAFYIHEGKVLYHKLRSKIDKVKRAIKDGVPVVEAMMRGEQMKIPMLRKGSRDYAMTLTIKHLSIIQKFIKSLESYFHTLTSQKIMRFQISVFKAANYDCLC